MSRSATLKLLVLFLALAFAANPAEAGSKRKRVAKHSPAASAQTGLRHEGPRMIGIRPGYWISNGAVSPMTAMAASGPATGGTVPTDRRAPMTFLPSLEVMLAYTAAGIVLVITPGPDMTLFLGQTLTGGRARGMAAYLGASAGLVVHTMLAAFGLSALLAHSATAFGVLKVLGVAYLLWLAIAALRHGSALTLQPGAAEPPQPLSRVFLMGVAVNLLNPKIVMFFLTFLPQFVSASDPHAGAKLMFLGLYFIVLAVPICFVLIVTADRFTAAIRRSPRVMRAIDWLFATLMGAFAVRLLFARAD